MSPLLEFSLKFLYPLILAFLLGMAGGLGIFIVEAIFEGLDYAAYNFGVFLFSIGITALGIYTAFGSIQLIRGFGRYLLLENLTHKKKYQDLLISKEQFSRIFLVYFYPIGLSIFCAFVWIGLFLLVDYMAGLIFYFPGRPEFLLAYFSLASLLCAFVVGLFGVSTNLALIRNL